MEFLHTRAILLLRLSLGIAFVWFGILKLFNTSSVIPIITKSFPYQLGHSQLFIFFLAIVEIAIGVSFLFNRVVRIGSFVMIASLLVVSIPVLIAAGFEPRFPVLSLVGESVIKNFVMMSAGLVLLSEKAEHVEKAPDKPQKTI